MDFFPMYHTVDGNPANQLRLVVYPIIYRVFIHIQGFDASSQGKMLNS